MATRKRLALVLVVLLSGLALSAVVVAAPYLAAPAAPVEVPPVVAYQGEVQVGGTPYDGAGYFKFAVVNAAGTTTYWSNDGTGTGGGEPTAPVQLAVADGLFSVLLGDTSLSGMSQALSPAVFGQPDRYLRVWFATTGGGTFDRLTPDTRIASVPYALQAANADTVDGLDAADLGADYANVVVVAKSGGHFTEVQAAVDSITDAAADNAYLVWVAPGVYSETVLLKPYVHLQGAGQDVTVITSTVGNPGWPPQAATLTLARDTSLRGLTVGHGGDGDTNVGVIAITGTVRAKMTDVTVRVVGPGNASFAIFVAGTGTDIALDSITAVAEFGSGANIGLFNVGGASATLRGGSYTGRGGEDTYGVFNLGGDTRLDAEDVTALGDDGSRYNYGLSNSSGGTAALRGGHYTARGGTDTHGVDNSIGSTMSVDHVVARAQSAGDWNYALGNYDNATMVVNGGSYIAEGGINTMGVGNGANGSVLEIVGATGAGLDGSGENHGFQNFSGGATVIGGSYTGRGGTDVYGISNLEAGTTLVAHGVTALAENGSTVGYGLYSDVASASLIGGSYTARGGGGAVGIFSGASGAVLEAVGVAALAEDAINANAGLGNSIGTVVLSRGSFIGRGGLYAWGIYNNNEGARMEAGGIWALGEGGSNTSLGISNDAIAEVTHSVLEGATTPVTNTGTITLSHSRLDGAPVSGAVTCVLVTRGTTVSSGTTCP